MPISREAWRLLEERKSLVAANTYYVSRYFIYSGADGLTNAVSWSWANSWRGTVEGLQRANWMALTTDATGTKHTHIVTVPLTEITGANPAPQQRVVLLDKAGNPQGEFLINFASTLTENGSPYAWELVVEKIM